MTKRKRYSVSYTHLDVYKRQAVHLEMPGERPSAFGARGAVVLALGRCSFHNGIGGGVPSLSLIHI